MMNADFLRQFNYETPPQTPLKRQAKVQQMYDKFSHTNGPAAFISGIKKILKSQRYLITENMFPYDVKPPIQHKCIWYNGKLNKGDIEEIIASHNIDECITYFENPPTLKSIKAINHYHLFHY